MKIILSAHAKERMKERRIAEYIVHTALLQPEKVEFDKTARNRYVAKRIFSQAGRNNYLLLVVYERTPLEIEVITVISTSKINKYF